MLPTSHLFLGIALHAINSTYPVRGPEKPQDAANFFDSTLVVAGLAVPGAFLNQRPVARAAKTYPMG